MAVVAAVMVLAFLFVVVVDRINARIDANLNRKVRPARFVVHSAKRRHSSRPMSRQQVRAGPPAQCGRRRAQRIGTCGAIVDS
jgi:hypothetical protein